MPNSYIEYKFIITPNEPWSEILIAELDLVGFESFQITYNGLNAYIPVELWDKGIFNNLDLLDNKSVYKKYQYSKIKQINWNSHWEKNFKPVLVNKDCIIRADFHKKTNYLYEIIITPKMSFGTGHHETTLMMMKYIFELNMNESLVLDVGSGTGILSILCSKLKAKKIEALDNDSWCIENSKENSLKNKCLNINFKLASSIENYSNQFDLILANINKNTLLKQSIMYSEKLKEKGVLIISGFYLNDLEDIKKKLNNFKLTLNSIKKKKYWLAAKFIKE